MNKTNTMQRDQYFLGWDVESPQFEPEKFDNLDDVRLRMVHLFKLGVRLERMKVIKRVERVETTTISEEEIDAVSIL